MGSDWNYVCIPHCKYQVKPHPSQWFSAADVAVIVYKNILFVCANRINLLNVK